VTCYDNVESDTWAASRVTAQHEPEDSRAGAAPSEPALDSSAAQHADPVGAKADDVRAAEPVSLAQKQLGSAQYS
jgi:hypothetical protein